MTILPLPGTKSIPVGTRLIIVAFAVALGLVNKFADRTGKWPWWIFYGRMNNATGPWKVPPVMKAEVNISGRGFDTRRLHHGEKIVRRGKKAPRPT